MKKIAILAALPAAARKLTRQSGMNSKTAV